MRRLLSRDPCMSWHYLPALVGESLGANSLDGAPSVRSKRTRTDVRCCFGDSGTACYPCFRSGMMLGPFTGNHGVGAWMWSLRASRANHSARPASSAVPMTPETAGHGPQESLAKWEPHSRSWRTSQISLLTATSEQFLGIWPRSATMRSGIVFLRVPSAPLIVATDSGYWPTPRAPEGCDYQYSNGDHNKPRLTLRGAVRKWPTPNANDHKAGMSNAPNRQQSSLPRTLALEAGVVSGGRGGPNPPWVEWLMGWPMGWTALVPLETGKFQQWLRTHGES